MKHTRIALLAAAALWGLPAAGLAQEGEEAPAAEEAPAEGEGAADAPVEGAEEFDDSEFEEGGEGVGDICQIDPAACPTLDMAKEAAKPLDETIKAVQQRFIIKKH